MKQKKIGTTLYVFDTTAYQITEDTDAAVIKIQLECIPAFEVLNESLKDKFEPINYKLYCVKHPEWADYMDDYTVSVSVTGNGAVSASPTSGDEGEEITLTVTPESGYEIDTLSAASGGTAITITDNKFIMPAGNVTVTATFQGQEFDITCAEAQYGTISAPATARLGDTVTITTTPAERYGLDTLTVMCGDVPVTITDSTFTMPAGDVTITATFKQVNFDITAFSSLNGTVNAYMNVDHHEVLVTSANVGDVIYLNYTQTDGYRMSSLGATCNGEPVTMLYPAQFIMPEGNVTLTGTFVAIDYANEYFTVEATADNTGITIRTEQDKTFEVSLDDGLTWIQATRHYSTHPRELDQYDRLLVRATGDTFTFTNDSNKESILTVDNDDYDHPVKVYGNIMSLLYGSSFANQTSLPENTTGNFSGLFKGCEDIVDAKHLILPATTLRNNCYSNIFNSCTRLTTAPELPATTLAGRCYYQMFASCTSLVTAPVLPATTLADHCYAYMFNGCTSLTTPPALPATTVVQSCYINMFDGCKSLTAAPDLNAATLVQNCYKSMFQNCSSLNYIKCLATNPGGTKMNSWVLDVAATGTFVKDANTTWESAYLPSGWTVEDYVEPTT